MTDSLKGISLTRATSLLLTGRVLGFVLSLGNSIILARLLGVEYLGQYAYAMGLAAMFGLLPNLGISAVVTRTIALEPQTSLGTLRAAVRAQVLLAVFVFGAVIGFAAVLPAQPVPTTYVILAAAQLALGTLSWPYLAVLGGRARYDRLAVAELVVGLAGTGLLGLAAIWQASVAAFLWAQVIAAGLSILVGRVVAAPFLPQTMSKPVSIRTLFGQAIPFGAAAAVQGFYTRADIMLLGQMSSPAIVGLYSAAYKPINMVINFGSTIAGALFPYLVQESRTGSSGSFDRLMKVLIVVAPGLALGLTGFAPILLALLYGRDFTAGAPILMILAWSAAANWLYAPLSVALQARGKERQWAVALASVFFLNLALNLWTIALWEGVGAAVSTLVSEAVLLGVAAFLVRRYLRFSISLRVARSVFGAALLGGGLLYALWSTGAVPATAAALMGYGGMLLLFRVASTDDLLKLMGRFRETLQGHARA
ncbi:MAG: flippase [Nitrospirota bacterium]